MIHAVVFNGIATNTLSLFKLEFYGAIDGINKAKDITIALWSCIDADCTVLCQHYLNSIHHMMTVTNEVISESRFEMKTTLILHNHSYNIL